MTHLYSNRLGQESIRRQTISLFTGDKAGVYSLSSWFVACRFTNRPLLRPCTRLPIYLIACLAERRLFWPKRQYCSWAWYRYRYRFSSVDTESRRISNSVGANGLQARTCRRSILTIIRLSEWCYKQNKNTSLAALPYIRHLGDKHGLVAWRNGNALWPINEVALRRAGLVHG